MSCQDNDYSLVDSLVFIDSQDYRYRFHKILTPGLGIRIQPTFALVRVVRVD